MSAGTGRGPLIFGRTPVRAPPVRQPVAPAAADRTIILIRTHYVTPAIEALLQKLRRESGWRVCFALDRLQEGASSLLDDDHVQITRPLLSDLGLLTTPDTCWRCGDYALYAARRQHPDATHLWMLEPDVRLNLLDVGDFFHLFARHPAYDLLTTFFGPAGPDYPWAAMMAPFAAAPHRCMFPLVRFSAAAIDFLLARRQALSGRFLSEMFPDGRTRARDQWPNDEVFTATELHQAGFRCADFNVTGIEFYNPATFSFEFPISAARYDLIPLDGKIYHPVLGSEHFIRKVRGMLHHLRVNRGPAEQLRHLFDRPQLLDDIRTECGREESERFAADVRAAIEAAG